MTKRFGWTFHQISPPNIIPNVRMELLNCYTKARIRNNMNIRIKYRNSNSEAAKQAQAAKAGARYLLLATWRSGGAEAERQRPAGRFGGWLAGAGSRRRMPGSAGGRRQRGGKRRQRAWRAERRPEATSAEQRAASGESRKQRDRDSPLRFRET